jgi:ferredoxin
MIFYFTGTGNSLYAARELAGADDGCSPVSIPQELKKKSRCYRADSIGIAAPVYGHEMPEMVRRFIETSEFRTGYFYIVLTYGNRHANAAELAADVCRSAGVEPDLIRTLLMVDNFVLGFDMEKQKKMDKNVSGQLDSIKADIRERRRYIETVTDEDRAAHESYAERVGGRPATVWADFDFTDSCMGCGLCTKVCPAGCIAIENHRAVRNGRGCQACMACLHVCPFAAIKARPVLGCEEKNPDARYRNEFVSLADLIAANENSARPAEANDKKVKNTNVVNIESDYSEKAI